MTDQRTSLLVNAIAAGLLGLVAAGSPALAQQPSQPKQAPPKAAVATPPAAAAKAAPTPVQGDAAAANPPLTWTARCASEGRKAALLCEVEQSMYITRTGQLVATMTVKLSPDTQPVMMLQLPVGVFLPAGIGLQIDERKLPALVFQTCDVKGCYAAAPLAPEVVEAMRQGKRMSVTFQNLAKEEVSLAFSLAGFAENYDKAR